MRAFSTLTTAEHGLFSHDTLAHLIPNQHQLLTQVFPQLFTASLRSESTELEPVFRLRHKVYCEEQAFEPCQSNFLETDSFDQQSLHCAITHNSSKQLAGTVRLVRGTDSPLPIEQFCRQAITCSRYHPDNFPRESMCEISRLAVPEHFRKRLKSRPSLADTPGLLSSNEQFCYPYIAIALYLAATAITSKKQLHHVFVMMEPRLARALSRTGIHFQQIGDLMDYHGKRAPYYADSRSVPETLPLSYQKLLNILNLQLHRSRLTETEISARKLSLKPV